MENKETLRQYFLYNKNIEGHDILDIFLDLDYKLNVIHKHGYAISSLNSDAIIYEAGGFNFDTEKFQTYASDEQRKNDIVNLAKLNLGTQVSIASGFSDFTVIPREKIAENFASIETSLTPATSGDEYLKTVLVKETSDIYYIEYLKTLKLNEEAQIGGRSNSRVKLLSTEAGRAMTLTEEDEAAFVNLAFYPIIIGLIIIVVGVILSFV